MLTSARASGLRVVDPVARHRYATTLGLQPSHVLFLVVGHHLGPEVVDAQPPGQRSGGPTVVAGQHDQTDMPPSELLQRFAGRLLERIADDDDRQQAVVLSDEYGSRALLLQTVDTREQFYGRTDVASLEQRPASDPVRRSVATESDAATGQALERVHLPAPGAPAGQIGRDGPKPSGCSDFISAE